MRGAGWGGRATPRASRSAWTTRAAATSSGSRVTVLATQSMYDGSKAAIWPSVWPWNLPNRRRAPAPRRGAAAAAGGSPGRRPRSSGPVGRRTRRLAGVGRVRRAAAAGLARPSQAGRDRPGGRSGLVAWPVRRRGVDPAGDGPRRSRPGGPPRRERRAEVGAGSASPALAVRRSAGQRRVGLVDLGHLPRRDARSRRVVAGQVRVMLPGEPPPGRLDLRGGAAPTPSTSAGSVWPRTECTDARPPPANADRTLDSPPCVPSPMTRGSRARAGLAAAIAAAPVGLAYRFALAYRARAGYPRRPRRP